MSSEIAKSIVREIEPLSADELIARAAGRVLDSGLPSLPAVEADGTFAGIFGEREFMTALFPGYVGELASSAMIRRSLDEAIERRLGCAREPIRPFLTTDPVAVDESYADTQLAETFLHHRVAVIPITYDGQVRAVVARRDFFRALLDRLERAA